MAMPTDKGSKVGMENGPHFESHTSLRYDALESGLQTVYLSMKYTLFYTIKRLEMSQMAH